MGWQFQNKVVPKAYINFVSKSSTVGTLGDRGTVAIAMPMNWGGDTVIKLTGAELLNGDSLAKVFIDLGDDLADTLPYRLAFAKASTCYFYRTNSGAGTKATGSIEAGTTNGTITAKYYGTGGNRLKVNIKAVDTLYNVTVSVVGKGGNGVVVEEHLGVELTTSLSSDYIEITTAPVGTVTTGDITLTGGVNSTSNSLTGLVSALNNKQFNCLGVYGCKTNSAFNTTVDSAIDSWRADGKNVQGVVYVASGTTPSYDSEGTIVVHQGFKANGETVDEDLFTIWVASMTAGANVNESLTAATVENAESIINEVSVSDYEEYLNAGRFILAYRADGGVKVLKDINSYISRTTNKGYEFSKNRVIRVLDEIGNSVAKVWENNYEGKQSNNTTGRTLFRNELLNLLNQLYTVGAVEEPSIENISVERGTAIDAVVATVGVQPVDSMEILYMTVEVG